MKLIYKRFIIIFNQNKQNYTLKTYLGSDSEVSLSNKNNNLQLSIPLTGLGSYIFEIQ